MSAALAAGQSPVAHPHCSTASTNCDSLCDSSSVTVQAAGDMWEEAGPSHATDCVNDMTDGVNSCLSSPRSHVQEVENSDAQAVADSDSTTNVSVVANDSAANADTAVEAETLTVATAQLHVVDESECYGASCCEACGTSESCSHVKQNLLADTSDGQAIGESGHVCEVSESPNETEKKEEGACAGKSEQDNSKDDVNTSSSSHETSVEGGQDPVDPSADPVSPESGRCSSGSTSPYNSGAEDDEEVALALQAAEVAATWRARAR